MSVAVQGSFDCDLTTIVDVWWEGCELKTGIRRNQRVQINHRSAVFPQESTGPAEVEVGYRDSYDLFRGINVGNETVRITGQGPKVLLLAILPEERVEYLVTRIVSPAHNRSRVVNRNAVSEAAAKCS